MSYRRIDFVTKNKVVALLQSRWKSKVVVTKNHYHMIIFCQWSKRIDMYNAINLSRFLSIERSRRIHTVAKKILLEFQRRHSYAYQDELTKFLKKKWSIYINRNIISRFLKQQRFNHKKNELIRSQSQQLRIVWQAQMFDVVAKQLFFWTNLYSSNNRVNELWYMNQ